MTINSDEKERVKQILLTPIHCDKEITNIAYNDGIILSPQKYHSKDYAPIYDPDMSDFAIGFYEILYSDILDSPILVPGTPLDATDQAGTIKNRKFAGDTMNSFNTIANHTPGAGENKSSRTPRPEWPDYLVAYERQYHCLANFWLLPLTIGRTTFGRLNKIRSTQDYMDRFLEKVKSSIDFSSANEYFQKFKDFKTFCEIHFLIDSYVDNNLEIKTYSYSQNSETIIAEITSSIENRAEAIAESKLAPQLLDYFKSLNLF